MKKIIILIALVVSIFIAFLFFLLNENITGFLIKSASKEGSNFYMHTKAICNESNFCQDYEIACNGTKAISIKPITGATIQHSENWKDQRNNSELCNKD